MGVAAKAIPPPKLSFASPRETVKTMRRPPDRWRQAAFWLGLAAAFTAGAGSIALATSSGGPTPLSNEIPDQVLRLVAVKDKTWAGSGDQGIGASAQAHYTLTDAASGRAIGQAFEQTVETLSNHILGDWAFILTDRQPWEQVISSGLVSLADDIHVVPVTGGTGQFQGAAGEVTWQFVQPDKADITITLKGGS